VEISTESERLLCCPILKVVGYVKRWHGNNMITNPEILINFEDDLIRNETVISYARSLNMLTSMWQEGVSLGVLPPKNHLDDIATDIRIAQVLNSCLTDFSAR